MSNFHLQFEQPLVNALFTNKTPMQDKHNFSVTFW